MRYPEGICENPRSSWKSGFLPDSAEGHPARLLDRLEALSAETACRFDKLKALSLAEGEGYPPKENAGRQRGVVIRHFVDVQQQILNCALPSFSLSSGFFRFQSLYGMSIWMIN